MKRIYNAFLILFFFGMLSSSVQASCCNAGFSTPKIPSSAKNWFRFIMHDSIAADIQSVHWSFGDNTYSTERTPYHGYYASGNYSVTLTVIKKLVNGIQKSCIETHIVSVTYVCADFTYNASQLNVLFFQTHNFDSASAHIKAKNYTWVFGDGNVSNELNPTHTYIKAGTYNVCLYQNEANAPDAISCSICHTVVVKDTLPVICRSDFAYSLTNSVVYLHSNSTVGNSYWWIEGDTAAHKWGNDAGFAISSKDSFTVCHRQYTDSIVGPGSAYCTECTTINHPVDTIPVICRPDFSYSLTDTVVFLYSNSTIGNSYWWIEGDTNTHVWGKNAGFAISSKDSFMVCHRQYTDSIVGPSSAYCEECNTIRPRPPVDTIPTHCNSDFNYTVTGNTVYAYSSSYADSANYFGNTWSISNEIFISDTTSVSYVFTSPGIKRICQSRVVVTSDGRYADTCTTCKDILIEGADVTIHPNPAVYQIHVQSNDEMISTIHLYDINGNLMKNISGVNVKKYNLDISDLVSGVYYVSTVLADGRVNKTKIIIQ